MSYIKENIEYIVQFKYEHIVEPSVWSDNFDLSMTWPVLVYKSHVTRTKQYMDRKPFLALPTIVKGDIYLFSKNRWYILDTKNDMGYCVSSSDKLSAEIPHLENVSVICATPYHVIASFDFDFPTMMTIMHLDTEIDILERTHFYGHRSIVLYNSLKVNVYKSVLAYRGSMVDEFYLFCEYIVDKYLINASSLYNSIFQYFKPQYSYVYDHYSLAYSVWYNAKRESQHQWPYISTTYPDSGILAKNVLEFPIHSGIYYFHPKYYVHLSIRHDDNKYQYIPKLYTRPYDDGYFVNKVPRDFLPYTIRNLLTCGIIWPRHKRRLVDKHNDVYIDLNYNGDILASHPRPKHIVFNGYVIGRATVDPLSDTPVTDISFQVLNSAHKRIMVLIRSSNEWVSSHGCCILGVPVIPYNYKYIVHDYNKLGKLIHVDSYTDASDLNNIGIVPASETLAPISWPVHPDTLYVSNCLETTRLLTFKYQKYVTWSPNLF